MTVRDLLYRFYDWLQRYIAPGLRYCQDEFEDAIRSSVTPNSVWLDLGCGHKILPDWRAEAENHLVETAAAIVGLDYDMPSLRNNESISSCVRGDISQLPFEAESFSVVTSNMVFEHLEDPRMQLKEIERILKPGGELIFLTPNTGGYTTILGRIVPDFLKDKIILLLEGREENDVFPTFYRINSPKDIDRAVAGTGLVVAEVNLIPSAAQFVVFPPLLILELLWIRLTMTELFRGLRTNVIVRCRKPELDNARGT